MPNRNGMGPRNLSHGKPGSGKGFSHGFGGECRCPNCGHRQPHKLATPCYHEKCPKCGAPLTRA